METRRGLHYLIWSPCLVTGVHEAITLLLCLEKQALEGRGLARLQALGPSLGLRSVQQLPGFLGESLCFLDEQQSLYLVLFAKWTLHFFSVPGVPW